MSTVFWKLSRSCWAKSIVDWARRTATNCWETLKMSWRSLSVTCERVDGGLILGGLQTVLALFAALEGVADAQVELRLLLM